MNTNATRFGPDEQLIRVLRCSQRLSISIDGATAETYEAIRPPARWGAHGVFVIPLMDVHPSLKVEQVDMHSDEVRALLDEASCELRVWGSAWRCWASSSARRPRPAA